MIRTHGPHLRNAMPEANFDHLSTMRKDAESIFSAGVKAVTGDRAIFQHCRMEGSVFHACDLCFDLNRFDRIWVAGAGKASAPLADALEKQINGKIAGGVVSVKHGHGVQLEKIRTIEAGHPVFDRNSVLAAEEILSLATSAGPEDLVIFLLSGGASALMAKPAPPVTPTEKQDAVRQLLLCGADITEINTIRKHLSTVKGGRIARAACPATLLTLIISDVVGDRLDVIGSGPTVPDASTYADCLHIIQHYGLAGTLAENIISILKNGASGSQAETPRADDPVFEKSYARIIAANGTALEAAREKAASLGYNTIILSSMVEGDTRAAARLLSSIAKEANLSGNPVRPPACILSGGETTVVVKGNGKGGRNQEFALEAALDIAGMENTVVLCGGTDGTDGPTDAAGGIVDGQTIERAENQGIDAESCLENNDSYHFLQQTGDLLVTGPTGTNVMDIRIFLVA